MKTSLYFAGLGTALVMAGCTSSGISRADVDQAIDISYATVVDVEDVKIKSEAGKSAGVGGLWGLSIGANGDAGDIIGGLVAGAILLGLTTKIAEGSSDAKGYTVEYSDGERIKIVTDEKSIVLGDCVAVESGRSVNVRRVDYSLCGPINNVVQDTPVDYSFAESSDCQEAKKQLMQVDDAEGMDIALDKVRALCES
jgi:outer membrane lipoprotein SlyB